MSQEPPPDEGHPAPPTRAEQLDRLRDGGRWDVAIIGGGATGLGAALDAASRGYRTVLLEAHDFAKGTSSRSTKLVHGGVRYLERGEVGLVREALHERSLLLRNAPGLVHARDFLVPAYRWWTRPYYALGLKAYDLLAGRKNLQHSRSVGRDEALRLIPTLERADLRGGVVYQDGQFDDARLAIALARTAWDRGASVLNYVAATGLIRQHRHCAGVEARDAETGETFAIRARVVVNAAGVFADEVRRLDDPSARPMVRPSQGAHVVLDRAFLPGETALLVPKTDDGRVLFAIPWLGKVLVGTTDTAVESAPIEPRPLPEEVAYILDYAGRYLDRDPGAGDVLSTFAGLRPLVDPGGDPKATAKLSREHVLAVSDSGLVTITGGKWTTYRRMAADAVDRAAEVGGLERRPCVTEALRLIVETGGLPEGAAPVSDAAVAWAARHEMARTVEDVLARRTRDLFLDARGALAAAPAVAAALASALGRDDAWREAQVRAFRELAAAYLPGASGSS
jgi:glycerol-3-phosphate dehydrogenase